MKYAGDFVFAGVLDKACGEKSRPFYYTIRKLVTFGLPAKSR
jgi:hypothetical protein